MPELSLAVCLYRERKFLERLLDHSQGCYDDLVVVHDGTDTDDVRSLVEWHRGRFLSSRADSSRNLIGRSPGNRRITIGSSAGTPMNFRVRICAIGCTRSALNPNR